MTKEELKTQHPHLYEEIRAEGRRAAVRERKEAKLKAAFNEIAKVIASAERAGLDASQVHYWIRHGATLDDVRMYIAGITGGKAKIAGARR